MVARQPPQAIARRPPRVPPVARQTAVRGGAFLGDGTAAAWRWPGSHATRGLDFRHVPLAKRRDGLHPDTTREWLSVRVAAEILGWSTAWDFILFGTFRRLQSAVQVSSRRSIGYVFCF